MMSRIAMTVGLGLTAVAVLTCCHYRERDVIGVYADTDEPGGTDDNPVVPDDGPLDRCVAVVPARGWTGDCKGTVTTTSLDTSGCPTAQECSCVNGTVSRNGFCPEDCSPPCAACPEYYTRTHDGTCCGFCDNIALGCAAEPTRCASTSDCQSGEECTAAGRCGRAVSFNYNFGTGNEACPQTPCWSNPEFFTTEACCPDCNVMCGSPAGVCARSDCIGPSCTCPIGGSCASGCACLR